MNEKTANEILAKILDEQAENLFKLKAENARRARQLNAARRVIAPRTVGRLQTEGKW